MKKIQGSLLATCLLFAMTNGYAVNHSIKSYKGEAPCPPVLMLQDGFYFGAEAGYDSYRIATDTYFLTSPFGTSVDMDPRLNVTGPVGGAFLGFGHYFHSLYDVYLGFEIFGNGSGAATDSELRVLMPSTSVLTNYSTEIKAQSNYGLSILPGIKLNNASLFYVRLGWNWTNIDVNEYVFVNNAFVTNSIYDVTSNGFNYGLGLETAIVPHVSLRGEFTHTDYSNFTTYAVGTQMDPADNQLMMALILHFG